MPEQTTGKNHVTQDHLETMAVHAGREIDLGTGAVMPPIHLSTTFERQADGGYTDGFVYSRSEHPLVIFDRDGNFLEEWGYGLLQDAHGLYIDDEDNVFCTERNTHCVYKFNSKGELLMTIGTPGQQGVNDGDPFRLPTDLAVASTGELFISDGYGNARVHKYTADGKLIKSWGSWGDGPSQFKLSHCVRIDRYDRVWVCDRENSRIERFDLDGNFIDEWVDLAHPDMIYFDAHEDVVYIAELDQQVSIYDFDRNLLA